MGGSNFRDRHPLLYAVKKAPRDASILAAILVCVGLTFLMAHLVVLSFERRIMNST